MVSELTRERVLVLDFGAQYSQLIARRVREQGVFCEILPYHTPLSEILQRRPRGLILSGGPAGVGGPEAPRVEESLFRGALPVLGICYGMQLGCLLLGARVQAGRAREYGRTDCELLGEDPFVQDLPRLTTVWMSHGDTVETLPDDFVSLARTPKCPYAAVRHRQLPFYGVQFHPEVTHTTHGTALLRNFLFRVCGCEGKWKLGDFLQEAQEELGRTVGDARVVCGLSGGVDSAVTAALVHRAIGERLTCIFVDNGLLRMGERDSVVHTFRENFAIDLRVVDATARFLSALEGVEEPEEKRKRIGHVFIDVFTEEAASLPDARFLAQGTLYPDVIESQSAWGGPSARIKTHHNVGALPERLQFELVEPLRYLFKDEVRQLGRSLGLPDALVNRPPFPGPGLAVRILGPVTRARLEVLREADAVVRDEIDATRYARTLWQYFAVLLPVRTVGVMGDERTYENVVAVRAVESVDGMTADWARLPAELLSRIAGRIVNEVKGVNRVVYDISSKPPGTIEWE